MRDVKVGDLLVIAKHTPVVATLTKVQRAPRGLRRGSLALEVKTISDINGNSIAVAAKRSETGPGERQAEAYTEAVLSLGFLAPPIFFCTAMRLCCPGEVKLIPPYANSGNHNPENHVVLVDGQKVARLRNWNFYDAQIAPGHHVVACKGQTLELDARPDEQYYVSVIQEHGWGRLTDHWVPRLTDPETGEEQMYPLLPAAQRDVYSAAH